MRGVLGVERGKRSHFQFSRRTSRSEHLASSWTLSQSRSLSLPQHTNLAPYKAPAHWSSILEAEDIYWEDSPAVSRTTLVHSQCSCLIGFSRTFTMLKIVALLLTLTALALSAPAPQDNEAPMPYNFKWEVNDQEYQNYYGQDETGSETGRVDGSYHVWLADGRLMTVTYYVDGESGFVPQITYTDNYNPFSGRR